MTSEFFQDSVKSSEPRVVTLLLPNWTLSDAVVRKAGSRASPPRCRGANAPDAPATPPLAAHPLGRLPSP